MTIEELKVKISAETSSLKSEIDKAKEALSGMAKEAQKVQSQITSSVNNSSSALSSGAKKSAKSTERFSDEVEYLKERLKAVSDIKDGLKFNEIFNVDLANLREQLSDAESYTRSLEEQLKNVKNELIEMNLKVLSFTEGDTTFEAKSIEAGKLAVELAMAKDEVDNLNARILNTDASADFQNTTLHIEMVKNHLNSLYQELEAVQMKLVNLYANDKGLGESDQEIIQTEKQLQSMVGEIKKAQAEYEKLTEAKNEALKSQQTGINDIAQMGASMGQGANTSMWDNLKSSIESAKSSLSGFASTATKLIGVLIKIGKAGVNAFKKVMNVTIDLYKKLSVTRPMLQKIGEALKRTGARIRKVFVYSTILKFFRAIKSTISEYLSSNTALMNALGSCKGAFLTAFQPIYEACIPALITLLNWITKIANAIAKLTSALFGVSAKASRDNAEALYNQAKATSAAGSAAEEAQRQILGFDEINKLEDNSSSGGGGSSDETDYTTFGDVDEWNYSSWGEAFSNFLDTLIAKLPRLQELAIKGAESINKFNTELYNMFSYDGVMDKGKELGAGLAEVLNIFNDNLDLGKAGQAISQALNFIISSVNSFSEAVDWDGIGANISNGLNNILSTLNFGEIGSSIANFFNMVWQTIREAVYKLDWLTLGQDLAKSFNALFYNMDSASMAMSLFQTIHGAVQSVVALLQNINWQGVADKIREFLLNLDWGQVVLDFISLLLNTVFSFTDALAQIGIALAEGILYGIIDIFLDIGGWVAENIVQPFINAVKSLFGIASPSTVMMELGNYISEGLFQGIKEGWTGITEWVSEKVDDIKTSISEKWESIKEKTSSAWQTIKDKITKPLASTKKESKSELTSMENNTKTSCNNMKEQVTSAMNEMKNAFTNTFNTMNTNVSSKITTLKVTFTSGIKSMTSTASSNLSSLVSQFTSRMNQIKNTVQNTANSLKGIFNFNAGKISVTVPKLNVSWNFSRRGSAYAYTPNYYVYYQTFAKGGFPEDGLFFANSGEMVGQFSNGKTAVANNAQIVEGIKEGVQVGVVNAIREASLTNTNSEKNKSEINIYLDGAQMAQRIYPYIQQEKNYHGMSLINA